MPVKDIFNERYGDNIKNINGQLRFIAEGQKGNEDEPPILLLEPTQSQDKVILVAQSLFLDGIDSTFNNFNGLKGQMQYQATLTKKGVTYEREN